MLLMKLGPNEALVHKGDDSWGSELNLNYLLVNDFESCKWVWQIRSAEVKPLSKIILKHIILELFTWQTGPKEHDFQNDVQSLSVPQKIISSGRAMDEIPKTYTSRCRSR